MTRTTSEMQNPAGGRGLALSEKTHEDRITVARADQSGNKGAPYASEVAAAILAGQNPNVYIFAGSSAWQRAAKRRKTHGHGSAMVLPPNIDPLDLKWPRIDILIVAWPGRDQMIRKIDLGRALVRDGVKHVHIEHEPRWIRVNAMAVSE